MKRVLNHLLYHDIDINMALWWCDKCQAIVGGLNPGTCSNCGAKTTIMVLK